MLDLPRLLITEINTNHEIRTPDGLARNVYLIRELNSNVAKVSPIMSGIVMKHTLDMTQLCIMQVVELYKELSMTLEQQHNQAGVAI